MRRPLCTVSILYILFVAVWLFFFYTDKPSPSYEEGEELIIIGQIEKKEYKDEQYTIYLRNIQNEPEIEGVLCYMQANTEQKVLKIGSYVKIKGKYQPFAQAGNEGQFDAKEYYQILHLDFSVRESQILEYTKQYSFIKEALYKCKEVWHKGYETYLTKEEAAFASAILLADKSGLDTELKELFQRNGLSHLLSVSGLHISFLGMLLYKGLKRLRMPETVRVFGSFLFILLYGMMIGATGATMRAIYMFVTYLFAKVLGRTYDMASALALAAMLLVMEQPYYLKYAGFWLSFGAVLAILVLYPVLKKCYELPSCFEERKVLVKLWDAFLLSLGIWIFTLPILLFYYYEVPLYSVLLNLVVIPVFSAALVSALIGGVAAVVSVASLTTTVGGMAGVSFFGTMISFVTGKVAVVLFLPLRVVFCLYQVVCGVTDEFTAGRWIVGKPHVWQMGCFYIGILVCTFVVKKEMEGIKKRKGRLFFGSILLLMVILCVRVRICTEITFLDVGQGDCCVVEAKNDMTFLVDAGSSDVSESGKRRLIPYLKANGIGKIDYAFISHPDEDHMNAVLECLKLQKKSGVYIKNIVLSVYAKNDVKYEAIKVAALKAGCNICYLKQGECMTINKGKKDEITFACLFPSGEEGITDTNEQSLVIHMETEGVRILLTGDIGTDVEKELVKQLKEKQGVDADILKVAHHGSKYSSSKEFLELFSPKLAVISCGEGNGYGHPHEETLNRLEEAGCKILTTPKSGAITVKIGKTVRVYEFRE